MNVFENVAYPLRVRRAAKGDISSRVEHILSLVHLDQYAERLPSQLSGGQQQRVALARALLAEPKLLLLDEPLSNLDAKLRETMRFEIKEIARESGITVVYVTHDQTEAMAMSDRIFLLNSGVVQQIGKPQEVYDNPANLFVAKFLGTPPINVFDGEVKGGKLFIGEDAVLPVPGVCDQKVTVGIRPEGFVLDENGSMHCTPTNVEVMGRDVSVVSTHACSLNPLVRSIINADNKVDITSGVVRYSLKPHKVFLFSKETEERILPEEA